ncbi:MAG: hypothetical protein NWE77_09090 [Candidatus Bathyarchaeota archaeon]|jgi:hypothetical protein|nr:hypothetical protein [Candidatus Bathyarchaeota archaeon]
MAPLIEKEKPLRLDDFIVLAKGGQRIEADIELRKQIVMQEVYPDEPQVRRDEVDAYLLMGDYNFEVEGESYRVSKVYVMGLEREVPYIAGLNRNIANRRLKMDYQRLEDADIKVVPKYF